MPKHPRLCCAVAAFLDLELLSTGQKSSLEHINADPGAVPEPSSEHFLGYRY
jgi:hypothetical protein